MKLISKRYGWYHVAGTDDWKMFGVATLNYEETTSPKDLSVRRRTVGKKAACIRFLEFLSTVDHKFDTLRWAFMADKRTSPKIGTHIYFLLGGIELGSDVRRQLARTWNDFGFRWQLVDISKAAKEKSKEYRRLLRTIEKNVSLLRMPGSRRSVW